MWMDTKKKRPPPQERRCQRGVGTEEQCRAARMQESQFCFFHDPGILGHRMELRELDRVPLGRSRDLHRLLARVVQAVERKRLDPQQAYAIGSLVRQMQETLQGVEKERNYHRSQSYGELVQAGVHKLRSGEPAVSEEEYGPDEAEPSEWIIEE